MDITAIIPLADSWGMHDGDIGVGWLIVMVPLMLLMMGGMIWMMMRGMGGSSPPRSETPRPTESAVEILERRFAEGEISIDDYRARRQALLDRSAEPTADDDEQLLTATRGGDGRRRRRS
jgi:putative membrane protein